MTLAAVFISLYFLIGIGISELANLGSKKLEGKPIYWADWVLCVFIWPVILMAQRRQ